MTLQNPGFEGGWSTDPTTGNQTPNGWTLLWRTPGEAMQSAGAFPGEPDPLDVVLRVPECVHKLATQLPPNEQPGGPDALILDGQTTYKVFGVGFSATLAQVVNGFHAGSRLTFRVPVQVHEHGDGSWGACAFRIGVDDKYTQWHTFTAGLDDREWAYIEASVVIAASDCLLRIDFEGRAVAPVSFFVDAIGLEIDAPEPEPPPGAPRVDYPRTYNVIPFDATEARAVEIFLEGWRRSKETAGVSFDDAGLGALTNKTARLYDIPADEQQIDRDWFDEWYPGTTVLFAGSEDPASFRLTYPTTHLPVEITQPFIWPGTHGGIDLRAGRAWNDDALAAFDGVVRNDTSVYHTTFGYFVLTSCEHNGNSYDLRYAHLVGPPAVQWGDTVTRGQVLGKCDNTGYSSGDHLHFSVYSYKDADYIDPEPLIDWPDDPPAPPPPATPIRPAGTRGYVSLHWTPTTIAGVQNFAQTIRPPAVKLTTAGGDGDKLSMFRQWSPDTLLVHRRVENGLDRYNPATAAPYVARYVADLIPHFNLNDFSKPPLYIVSINEVYECGATANNIAAAAWDIAFMQAVEDTGLNLRAVVYAAPVGNPHTTAADLQPLLPMVAKAVAGKHVLGKHCYYASVPDDPLFYQQSWDWYGGRFALDDAYFVSQGLSPYWMPGEGGACQATVNSDGSVSLNPGAGWKACGSIQRYAAELVWANNWYKTWDAAHGGRLLNVCLFTTGGWDWYLFDLQGGDLDVVTATLNGVL